MKLEHQNKRYRMLKIAALCVLVFVALLMLMYGAAFVRYDWGDMKVNYWKADQLYYDSIGLFFSDLESIILGTTLLAAALWKLGSLLIPSRMPKLPKPISCRNYRIIALSFGALLTIFIMLITRQRQLILTHDFSQDEAPWSENLYYAMGMYEIGALLSLEGFVFSTLGLLKKRVGKLERIKNGEDKL